MTGYFQCMPLITNLPAANGLSRLKAGFRAQIKGLTIIINLISHVTSESPHGHLIQHTHLLKASPPPCHQDVCLILPLLLPLQWTHPLQ
jgi:hypothetical protein